MELIINFLYILFKKKFHKKKTENFLGFSAWLNISK